MGPMDEVPSISAGGAVDDPSAVISKLTPGCICSNVALHCDINPAKVSDPTLVMLADKLSAQTVLVLAELKAIYTINLKTFLTF